MARIFVAVAATTIVLMSATLRASQGLDASPARSASGAAESAALRARGLEQGFNLDYTEALATFRQAIAADPSDPASHRLVAATVWVHLLFQHGAITINDYLGQTRSTVSRTPPPPELAALFHEHLSRARTLCEQRLRDNRQDVEARYQLGASVGMLASYLATVEGRVLGSVKTARQAFSEHDRVMELDPRRKDAGLIVGMYRYAVSALPAPLRLAARLAGFRGGKQQGLRLVEDAARHASDAQTNALFTLIVIYTREARHDEALDVIGQLQARYPRNRLLWLEAGSAALRAGRPAEARAAIEEGLAKLAADERPRAFGEEARWFYYYGVALAGLGEREAAARELRRALVAKGHDWVYGRAHLELGKLAAKAGDRQQAIEEYIAATRLCEAGHDKACVEDAGKLGPSKGRVK